MLRKVLNQLSNNEADILVIAQVDRLPCSVVDFRHCPPTLGS